MKEFAAEIVALGWPAWALLSFAGAVLYTCVGALTFRVRWDREPCDSEWRDDEYQYACGTWRTSYDNHRLYRCPACDRRTSDAWLARLWPALLVGVVLYGAVRAIESPFRAVIRAIGGVEAKRLDP